MQPLAKSVLTTPGLTTASAADTGVQKKTRVCETAAWLISNEEMDDVMKIVKSLYNSGLLLKWVTKTIENEIKEQKGGFLSLMLDILDASLLGNLLSGTRVFRAGNGVVRDYDGMKERKDF